MIKRPYIQIVMPDTYQDTLQSHCFVPKCEDEAWLVIQVIDCNSMKKITEHHQQVEPV